MIALSTKPRTAGPTRPALPSHGTSSGTPPLCCAILTTFWAEALALELKPLGIHATVIKPGFFRTDCLDPRSWSVSPAQIDDYTDTAAGAMRGTAVNANHRQRGDPAKLAKALLTLVDAADPPLRMPFGSDTVRRIEAKTRLWPMRWPAGATLPHRPTPHPDGY